MTWVRKVASLNPVSNTNVTAISNCLTLPQKPSFLSLSVFISLCYGSFFFFFLMCFCSWDNPRNKAHALREHQAENSIWPHHVMSQLTATMGSTERMSLLPVRACRVVKSTCASLLPWDSLEGAWLLCEDELPEWAKACLGLELSWFSGQATL